MSSQVYVNGLITCPEKAKVSVFDRGFLYGDSVYEVTRSSNGKFIDLEPHLQRLERSAASLALPMPSPNILREAIKQTASAAGQQESYLRVVVTRGEGELGLDANLANEPTLIVIVKPLVLPDRKLYQNGVKVRLVNVQRTSAKAVDPSVKSGNYLNNILALAEAKKNGAYEAIMCDRQGIVAEGASSNIFWVKDQTLYTPSVTVGLLAGITRQRVLEIAGAQGDAVCEGRYRPDELRQADEAFITSSIRGVMPIRQVNESSLSRSPGKRTLAIMKSYQEHLLR